MSEKRKSIFHVVLIAVIVMLCVTAAADCSLAKSKPKKPAKVKGVAVKSIKQKTATIKWKKAKNAKKYVVNIKKGSKTILNKTVKKTSLKVTGLKASTSYKVFVKGKRGKKSGKASKTVKFKTKDTAPVIIDQSGTRQVFVNEKTTLFVAAKGKNLKYRWYNAYDDEEPVGMAPRFIARYDEDFNTDEFEYYCVVSNNGGKAVSKRITVVLPEEYEEPQIEITKKPYLAAPDKAADQLFLGDKVKIDLECKNATSYQWYYSSEDIDEEGGGEGEEEWEDDDWEDWGMYLMSDDDDDDDPYQRQLPDSSQILVDETSKTLEFTATLSDSGYYFCKLSDGKNDVISTAVKITVHGYPDIITQPENALVAVNKPAKFSVAAKDVLWFEWQYLPYGTSTWKTFDQTLYGTKAEITVPKSTADMDGQGIRCIAHGYENNTETSSKAYLYVGAIPTVKLTAPVKATKDTSYAVKKSSSVKMTVSATGSKNMKYQWYKGSTAISGATSTSYTAKKCTAKAKYRCKVTNGFGKTYSPYLTITIK